METFSKVEFISNISGKLNSLESALTVLRNVANNFRIRLDTEGGRETLRELSKIKVTGGNKSLFGIYGNTFDDFLKGIAQQGEQIIDYINDGIDKCPIEEKEKVKTEARKCIDDFIYKERSKPSVGFGKLNTEYIINLLIKLIKRIKEDTLSLLPRIPQNAPAKSVLWGGKLWNVVTSSYYKKLKIKFEKMYTIQQTASTHCNGYKHPADCQCGWGGPKATATV